MLGAILDICEEVVVEWAPFRKKGDVSDHQILSAAEYMHRKFYSKQRGFMKRELVKKSDGAFADIVHWRSQSEAAIAAAKTARCDICSLYFGLMDVEETGSCKGVSSYQVVRTWNAG